MPRPWYVEYDNDTGYTDDGYCEWWNVSDGFTTYKTYIKEDAMNLCAILNKHYLGVCKCYEK